MSPGGGRRLLGPGWPAGRPSRQRSSSRASVHIHARASMPPYARHAVVNPWCFSDVCWKLAEMRHLWRTIYPRYCSRSRVRYLVRTQSARGTTSDGPSIASCSGSTSIVRPVARATAPANLSANPLLNVIVASILSPYSFGLVLAARHL